MSELENFVNKFHQLRQAGYTAHLNVDAKAGQSWVSLCVMLGSGPVKRPKQRSPSYLKRQERRKAAWLAAENSSHESDAVKASEAQITEEVNENLEDVNNGSNETEEVNTDVYKGSHQ